MDNEKILIKIKALKEIKKEIENEIDNLEKRIKLKKELPIIDENTEMGYYTYLTVIKKLNDHTARNYFYHLRGIKKRLEKFSKVKMNFEIYNISDKDRLLQIKNEMNRCHKLIEDNKIQHNAFTAAFNNYINYVFNYYKKENKELLSEFVFDD